MSKGLVEKVELPVTITKVKVGGKFLTKSLLEQLPMDLFIHHFDDKKRYGIPCNFDTENGNFEYYIDEIPYEIDGTIIGYLRGISSQLSYEGIQNWIKRYNGGFHSIETGEMFHMRNYTYPFYYIIWYDKNNTLKRGYIDEMTAKKAGVILEQIFI